MDKIADIYIKQEQLMHLYQGVYGIPSWPLDIQSSVRQSFIRELVGGLSEELSEFFEDILKLNSALSINPRPKDLNEILGRLSGEASDCLHFLIELYIYSGITRRSISLFSELGEEGLDTEIYNHAYQYLKTTGLHIPNKGRFTFKEVGLTRYGICDEDVHIIATIMWDITFSLNKALNTLKNKPWKKTEVPVDTATYQENLIPILQKLFAIYIFLGYALDDVYEFYTQKNLINQKRIQEKY